MAKLTVIGVIKEITPVKSGISQTGKEWSKCELVITEQNGQYPNDVSIIAFNNTISLLTGFTPDSYVQVTAWASSQAKDKNGEVWYQTQLRLNEIIPMATAQQYPQPQVAVPQQQYGYPPQQQQYQQQNYSQQAPQSPQQPLQQQQYRAYPPVNSNNWG